VLLHRPKDLDTASSLAILEEEVLSGSLAKEYKRLDSYSSTRSLFKSTPIASSTPTSLIEQQAGTATTKPDEKLANLMAYRKAQGLCFKCGGKWGPQHKCPASVPLNMIEEVWQLLDDCSADITTNSSDSDPDKLMSLSDQAVKGTCATHTLKLHAY
jgi:hypothetical protein